MGDRLLRRRRVETSMKIVIGLLISGVSFLGGNWIHGVDKDLVSHREQVAEMRIEVATEKQAVRIYIENQQRILEELTKLSAKLDAHMYEARAQRRKAQEGSR
jgi:hypothetical protein